MSTSRNRSLRQSRCPNPGEGLLAARLLAARLSAARLSAALFVCGLLPLPSVAADPPAISFQPVVIVCSDQRPPSEQLLQAWQRHLEWTRRFYAERLEGDTFQLEAKEPAVVRVQHPLAFYQRLPKGEAAPQWTGELLSHFGFTRFNCPLTFCCLIMNPKERWPIAGGRTINGGINRGGGILVMSSFALERLPNFQSTLRHEIAHTVGLPHVDVYGYSMKTTRSVMAYNTKHQTNGFRESRTPARLIPEDARALALADRVFPKTRFDAVRDVRRDYDLFPRIITLPPMKIPGRPNYDPRFTTPSGEDSGSRIQNLNQRFILPSQGPGVTFDKRNMWASSKQPGGKVVVEIEFPVEVTLTSLRIHSEHSGQYNRAAKARMEAVNGQPTPPAADTVLMAADAQIDFPAATSRQWRLTMQAGPSGKVCLRGLQFFHNEAPVFPPPVPYRWQQAAAK